MHVKTLLLSAFLSFDWITKTIATDFRPYLLKIIHLFKQT